MWFNNFDHVSLFCFQQIDVNLLFDLDLLPGPEVSSPTKNKEEELAHSPTSVSMIVSCPTLTCKTGVYKRSPGFQPTVCCMIPTVGSDTVPLSNMAVSSEFGVWVKIHSQFCVPMTVSGILKILISPSHKPFWLPLVSLLYSLIFCKEIYFKMAKTINKPANIQTTIIHVGTHAVQMTAATRKALCKHCRPMTLVQKWCTIGNVSVFAMNTFFVLVKSSVHSWLFHLNLNLWICSIVHQGMFSHFDKSASTLHSLESVLVNQIFVDWLCRLTL